MATLIEIRKPGPYTRRSIVRKPNPSIYTGYFRNCHGEDWVFTYDRQAKRGELRGTDTEWGNALEVGPGPVVAVLLSVEERAWLSLCWKAATECQSEK